MKILTVLGIAVLLAIANTEAKILEQCEAVKALELAQISRSMISNYVCVIRTVSNFNTNLITGPKTASSYEYGIFQISSLKWCKRGRRGGLCNSRCEDFADDNITDDIACAKKIVDMEGFKQWDGWLKNCKNKPLPNISMCDK